MRNVQIKEMKREMTDKTEGDKRPELMCELCHKILNEGNPMSATISGEIKDGQFKPDDTADIKIMCEVCADLLDEISADLDRAMELMERAQ